MSRPVRVMSSAPLRLSDLCGELQAIAALAEHAEDAAVVVACRRAQSLLDRLRNQFLEDVLGDRAPAERDEAAA